MPEEPIQYEAGYKYQLHRTCTVQLEILGHTVFDEFYCLTADGLLTIREGYAWDGASGPAIDTPSIMRPSLVHDVLFQMMRRGQLPQTCFEAANRELRRLYLIDAEIVAARARRGTRWMRRAVAKARAWWLYVGVKDFGGQFAAVQPEKVLTAP